jgi:hypothetical protein
MTDEHRDCSNCRWGWGPLCELGLDRWTREDGSVVCDPGDWYTPEEELKDCWESKRGEGETDA